MFRFCVALAAASAVASASAADPPPAGPPPVEAYGKLPGIEQVVISPSGDRFAFIGVAAEKRRLIAASVDDTKAILNESVGAAKVVNVTWAGEDHLLVTVSHTVPLGFGFTTSQTELTTVVVINLKTRGMISVFDKHPQVGDFVEGSYGVAQVNGHWYGYFGGVTYGSNSAGFYFDHGWPDLYRVDLDSGAIQLVSAGSELAHDWVVGPDGKVIARTTYNNTTGAWRVLTGPFAGKELASGTSKVDGIGELIRGRTDDTVVIHRPGPNGATFQELSLTGAPVPKMPEVESVDGVLTDRVTGLRVGTETDGDQPESNFFTPAAEARVRGAKKAFQGLSTRLVSYTPDLSRMVMETSGTGDSGTFWLVDIATHKASPIGYEYPDVGPDDVGTIRMVDYKAADGLALHGVLNLPPGREAKNLPVIVMPHGGPEDRDYPQFWWWSQLFASRGYAVFQPNFRGSSGYGQDFRDAGFGQMGRKMQTDVSDGLAELVKQGIVDPKRACIVGWSYGGYAALAGVTVQHSLYRCAVSMAGVSDLAGFLDYVRAETGGEDEDTDSVRYWKRYMGVTSLWETELKPYSPVKQAAQADAPILLIHGKDDTVVPIDQGQSMERALKGAGKPVELVTLTGADHWLLHEDTRLAMAKASLDFVLKYDPPDPAPAPAPAKTAANPAGAGQ